MGLTNQDCPSFEEIATAKKVSRGYCGSHKCTGIRNASKRNFVFKTNLTHHDQCPDCKEYLFWQTENVYQKMTDKNQTRSY